MPALPVITDVFRVTLNWTGAGRRSAHNVMHFLNTGGTETDVFNDIDGAVTAAMWDFVVSSGSVTSLSILKLDGASATVVFPISGLPVRWQGAGSGTDWIPQGCGVVTERTVLRGRSHRGRVYLPWVAEAEQTSGVLADVAACQTAWNLFHTNMIATTTDPVVASYKLASAQHITSYTVRPTLKTQRRRAV